ncbi:MAG: sialidase, partial [Verrucomicrobiaceae bacterium]|nr:sialidase [Verrucomicrobiaceae bacterium]
MKYLTPLFLLLHVSAFAAETPAFKIEHSVVLTTLVNPETLLWAQSRAALVPGNPPRVILTTQQTEKAGAHGYRDVYMAETKDGGHTWSEPQVIESLKRKRMPEGHDLVMGDICPQWHAATGVVLATGKTFGFQKGVTEDHKFERVSYAVFNPGTNQWSGLNLLSLPEKDHEGKKILEANAGCNQRFDLPGGDILLPIRYRKDPKTRQYTTIIARCGFDGTTLTYKEHGSELTVPQGRGLYEPSVTGFQGLYYATLRGDQSAFVARSKDGVNYEPVVEWTYDDGKGLGCNNTQQHWVTHSGGLYLIYTRRGANNDHVFRNRAPLFIARVDPERLCVLRATEQVLMPENGLDLGAGFGTMD